MSLGNEMMETIGYKLVKHHEDKKTVLLYRHKQTRCEIGFNLDSRDIFLGNKESNRHYIPVSLEELKAIRIMCEELWG